MSVLVKGMVMPETCAPCPFSKLSMDCRLTGRTVHMDWIKRKRPDWCPLVEVPTPHGKLIDADALMEKPIEVESYQDSQGNICFRSEPLGALPILSAAPTVIEAEEEA